jgi:hypothetical protein
MILIFDTYGGLCNQMYDINSAINFCTEMKINFSFRHCSLRNENLVTWSDSDFSELFDDKFLHLFDLYIPYSKLKNLINQDNSFNYDSKRVLFLFDKNLDLFTQFKGVNKEFIFLKQFIGIHDYLQSPNIHCSNILPSNEILSEYYFNSEALDVPVYNFLAYRYERDFTTYFNISNITRLDFLLSSVSFKNKNIPIYVACSNIEQLSEPFLFGSINDYNVIYKKRNVLNNFEKNAFLDFLFGKNAQEVCGHIKSSFALQLNFFKGSKNFYE